jgi:hypothetical protein
MTIQPRLYRNVLAVLLGGVAALSAASANAQGLLGKWVLAPERSSFVEAVTGPAPEGGEWIVSRDDGDRLVYTLVETRQGDVVATAAYDVSLHGGPSQSHVDGDVRDVVAARATDGSTIIQAPAVAAWRASIRIHQISAREAVIEHVVSGPSGDLVVERLVMERASPRLATATADRAPLQ